MSYSTSAPSLARYRFDCTNGPLRVGLKTAPDCLQIGRKEHYSFYGRNTFDSKQLKFKLVNASDLGDSPINNKKNCNNIL